MSRFYISYFLFCFFSFAFIASGFIDSQDGFQYLAVSRRLYYDHTLEMPTASFDSEENIHLSVMENREGKIYSVTGLGYSLALLPAVALEHMFLILSGNQPLAAFPLQNDWVVLLFASMTNAVFAALTVVLMHAFMRRISINHTLALFLSFGLFISTYCVVYAKHSFAQMMFSAFTLLCFYLVKKSSQVWNELDMFWAGVSFGIVIISYNASFVLIIPALTLYYFLTHAHFFNAKYVYRLVVDIVMGVIGMLPFYMAYSWFEWLRSGGTGATTVAGVAKEVVRYFPKPYVIVEGVWGLMLSPGKSVFLFAPILLTLFFFWFYFSKKVKAELVSFSLLFFTFLWFFATLQGGKDFLVWHGESSWGPRYLVPVVIPLLILIAYLFSQATKKQKKVVFIPLMLLGLIINTAGVLLPYQIKFSGLQTDAFFNGRNFNVYEYGNLLPRYSPAFAQFKNLLKTIKKSKRIVWRGTYQLRLVDGFDAPFFTGDENYWRSVRPQSVITVSSENQPINSIELHFANHLIEKNSTESAVISIKTDKEEIKALLKPGESKAITLNAFDESQSTHTIDLSSAFELTIFTELKKRQVLFLTAMRINGEWQRLDTIDYPYVSPISKSLLGYEYHYWGGSQQDPWDIWHMRSGVYEQTFDIWWIRPFHYWDFPKAFFLGLFVADILGIIVFGWLSLVSDSTFSSRRSERAF